MTTKTAIDVPADSKWRHVIAAAVLAAVRASGAAAGNADSGNADSGNKDPGQSQWGQGELGRLGDLSLLLDRALDDIDSLAGVSSLTVEVESGEGSALVSVIGEGEDLEHPAWASAEPFVDPLTGSTFEWNQTAVKCSFRIAVEPS
ncbi:MAG TPA: hypothetical protein VM848_04375 [Acidimicrobiia bacterium]|nr:hypothetical protein [Acidimicrobiia bacterium]